MGIIIINPQLTMQDTTYADKFNEEVIKQLRKYGVEFYEISSNNIERYKVILSEKLISVKLLHPQNPASPNIVMEFGILITLKF